MNDRTIDMAERDINKADAEPGRTAKTDPGNK